MPLLSGFLATPVLAKDLVANIATSRALQGSLSKGTAEGLRGEDPQYALNEEFSVELSRKKAGDRLVIGTFATSSIIWCSLEFWTIQQAGFATRAQFVDDFLKLLYEQYRKVNITSQAIISNLEDLEKLRGQGQTPMTSRQADLIASAIQADGITLRQQVDDIDVLWDAIQYQNTLEVNPPLLNKLNVALESGDLTVDGTKALQGFFTQIQTGNMKWFEKDTINILKPLFATDDIMGLQAILKNSDEIISSTLQLAQKLYQLEDGFVQFSVLDDLIADGATIRNNASVLSKQGINLVDTAKESRKITDAASAAGKGVSKFFLIDTAWWLVSLGVDIGWNAFGTDEEDQKIPFFSDLPYVGTLFDFSDKAGSSPLGDLIIVPLINSVLDLLGVEQEVQTLYEVFLTALLAASQAPVIGDAMKIVLNLLIEINVESTVDLAFGLQEFEYGGLPFMRVQDPLRILEVFIYACVAKIVFKAWVMPSVAFFQKQLGYAA